MHRTLVSGLAAGLLSFAFSTQPLVAQTSEVASFPDFVGHDHGERITVHHQMESYLRYLAANSDRVEIVEQGESWEGRQLLLAIVTSPANHARLGEIQATARRLGDPRELTDDEAQALIADQPAIVFMGGSIHGFELSGAEGVLKLVHHMTTRDDAATLEVLDNVVLLLDPMLNPDGRDAFAHRNHRSIGREPKSARDDWSNDFTRWDAVGYRTGHYFFDTNRDWWAHTQRETQARVPTIQAWRPQVVIDLHEMGSDVEFYFDPPDVPYGPFFPEFAREWFVEFGNAYAEAFDEAGFEYMTRERYNFFYPGYTTSWGSYQGAVGMLYEQGSTRGLAMERADESVRLLADALEQQYTAAWTAARVAATRREELLSDYVANLRAAIADGRRGVRRYLIEPGGDPQHLAELVALLERNGIEVGRLAEDTTLAGVRDRAGKGVGDRTFAAGTYVVEAAQPANRLVRALLEPDLPLPDDFLEIARQRIDRGANPRFYDITAWSLPLLFDQAGYSSTDGRTLAVESIGAASGGPTIPDQPAGYAYLIDGSQAASVAALLDLKRAGYRASVTLKPTSIAEEAISTGTVVLRVGQNDDSLHGAVRDAATRRALTVRAVDTGLSDPGYPSLGSADVMPFRMPEIALLGDDPVHGYSFGWAWYTLDRQYEIPVTVRTARSIRSEPIHRFDVLVIPHLFSARELGRLLGDEGKDRLKKWIEDGGSLVALGSAVDFVREELELAGLRSWYDVQTGRDKMSAEEKKEDPIDPADEPTRFDVPGAIVAAELDPEAWLSAGYDGTMPGLVDSSRLYVAPEGPPNSGRRVVARYAGSETLRLSGFLWPETAERLPGTVLAYEERIGDGRVILIAEDLNFRGYWRGSDRLFLNAVVLSPSAP
jgi:hypothetical protein